MLGSACSIGKYCLTSSPKRLCRACKPER
ncbi:MULTISPECIES: Dickkopf N-terminal cysteine-rich domain-containing protein [Pasteurellaceae]